MKKINNRLLFAFCAPFVLGGASSQGTSESVCIAEPELPALTHAELEQNRGHFENAQRSFLKLLDVKTPSLAARAAYRLAEIEEFRLWSSQTTQLNFKSLLDGVQKVRAAYLSVTNHSDAFWSRRSAYRIITLMDEALLALQNLGSTKEFKASLSPFGIFNSHFITNKVLDAQIAEFENESRFLERTLLRNLHPSDDKDLIAALKARASEGMSPFLGDFVAPPWAGSLPSGLVVKYNRHYFEIGEKQTLKPLQRKEAIAAMHHALTSFTGSLPFAFALAQLSEEQEAISEELVSAALKSDSRTVRLAGLYAAQRAPSHALTQKLLALWPVHKSKAGPALFATAQDFFYGERERLLLALSTHFGLGRESTQKILSSTRLPDEEKAWLLQFRRDKTSIVYAENFMQHDNPLVKSRAQDAMRAWHS